MAQTEDTELRDLLMEALEKNGSLAKIRGLLRANVFLAFENEQPTKENVVLDNILKMPEGILALTIISEFLEFSQLQNSLFVYKAESRQGKEYSYQGRNFLLDQLANLKITVAQREPVLVTILKQLFVVHKRKTFDKGDYDGDNAIDSVPSKSDGKAKRDDENCTYIVHEDSSSQSTGSLTQSDNSNSSVDKNKLQLRLPLDNSDTDTSSDSREKTCSEYIPNIHLDLDSTDDEKKMHAILSPKTYVEESAILKTIDQSTGKSCKNKTFMTEDVMNPASSDSTSYLDFGKHAANKEPHFGTGSLESQTQAIDKVDGDQDCTDNPRIPSFQLKPSPESQESGKSKNSLPSLSGSYGVIKYVGSSTNLTVDTAAQKISPKTPSEKSDAKSIDYSYDFASSKSQSKENSPRSTASDSIQEEIVNMSPKESINSPRPSHSSISLSDVADLIENSAQNSPLANGEPSHGTKEVKLAILTMEREKRESDNKLSSTRNDSDLSSDSPVHSLSNISLDFHSD